MKSNTISHRGIILLSLLITTCYISILWTTLPFFQSSGGIALWHTGYTDSIVRGGFLKYPQHIGLPSGAPVVFGASLVYIQSALGTLTQLNGITTYSVTGFLLSMLSIAGCYSLARHLETSIPLSIILTAVLLSQVFFATHIISYGATGYGFTLLPAACALYIWFLNKNTALKSSSLLLIVCSSFFLVFLDGYSFVMAASCCLAVCIGQMISNRDCTKETSLRFILTIISFIAAAVAYKLYVPNETTASHSLGIFGILALDPLYLFKPTFGYSVLHDFLGSSAIPNTSKVAGLGLGNHETVFLGWSTLILAGTGLLAKNQSKIKVTAITMIAIGFLLSLGPVGPQNNLIISQEEISKLAKFPAYYLYSASGFDQMRATYRWVALIKLGIWMLTCLGCQFIAKKFTQRTAILIVGVATVFMLLETTSPPLKHWTRGANQLEMAHHLKKELTEEIKHTIPPGSKILFLPITNDFVIHSIAAESEIYTYNVANDKNLNFAESIRPTEIKNIASVNSCFAHDIWRAHQSGLLDFVAIRNFDSHRGRFGWKWPPSQSEHNANKDFLEYAAWRIGDSSKIIRTKYFYFIDASTIDKRTSKSKCSE